MKKEKYCLNEAVIVFDQKGVITDIVDETRKPYLYGVTFDETKKNYVIEAAHIELQEDTRHVTERIKTFEDACRELGETHPFVQHFRLFESQMQSGAGDMSDIAAYMKARIIVAALNEGWEPKFEKGEWRYAPWYSLLTNEEIEELDEDEKQNVCRVVGRAGSYASASGGLVCGDVCVVSAGSHTVSGSRLAFKSEELAKYAGKQFIEIFGTLAF